MALELPAAGAASAADVGVSTMAGRQFETRRATQADAAALSELILETLRVSNGKDYDAVALEAVAASFTREAVAQRIRSEEIWVLLRDDVLVGTAGLRADFLRSMFVSPGRQRQGIGRRLVGLIEDIARTNGISEISVNSSHTARSFYEALGYGLVDVQPVGDGSTVLMKKPLA